MFDAASSRSPDRSPAAAWALAAVAAWLVLLAGCDQDDSDVLKLPRLTGKTYVAVRVDPADPSRGRVELTNVGETELGGLEVFSDGPPGLPPIKADVTLAPSQTRDLGPLTLDGETYLHVWARGKYFPQMFRIFRRADGKWDARDDPKWDESDLRAAVDRRRSAERWGWFYAILKVGGAVAACGAAVAALARWRRRRGRSG